MISIEIIILELEELCHKKLLLEQEKINEEKTKLAVIKKSIEQEKLNWLSNLRAKSTSSSISSRKEALKRLFSKIHATRANNDLEVIQAETDLLKHYSNLLMHKLQIEQLLESEEMRNEKNEIQKDLMDEKKSVLKDIDMVIYFCQFMSNFYF